MCVPVRAIQMDSTRYVQLLRYQRELTLSERRLASVEARPGITLSGGFKRLEANNSNSLLIGISLPLPLFNRNQGNIAALEATIRSNEYEQERARLETKAYINSTILRLNQLTSRHMTLDTLLLPTAENAYKTLQATYDAGRIPYSSLLEAERSLIEIRFEHNEVLFAIHEQLMAIEQVSGIKLY